MPEGDYRLLVEGLVSGYGTRAVLDRVTLNVAPGEVVALIGHNGSGKSTLLQAIFGLLPIWAGRVFIGEEICAAPSPRSLLRAGVAYAPQGGRIFSGLTVLENIQMGGATLPGRAALNERIEHVITLFPDLKPRLRHRASTLSGGQKQQLSLANALVVSPRLLLLDEPALGLAPPLVPATLERIRAIAHDSGTSVIVVEQKVREVLKIADRVYVMRRGAVCFSGAAGALDDQAKLLALYL